MAHGNCHACRFHNVLAKDCRAEPPKPFVLVNQLGKPEVLGAWPPVQENDWCGRFELDAGVAQ